MSSAYDALTLPSDDEPAGKVVNRYFDALYAKIDIDIDSDFAVSNQVDTLPEDVTIDGGNYTITITLHDGQTFTTASIAWNANAATVETAIDDAADSASIEGFTAGDISVSGGDVATADLVLTYDGTSVAGLRHSVAVATDVDIATGTLAAFSTTTDGHPSCPTLSIVNSMGFLVIADVNDPDGWVRNQLADKPERCVWDYVARQAKIETQLAAAYTKVLALGGFSPIVHPVQ